MDNSKVICFGRQLGSGGREIAEKLAKKLDLPLYDKEILALAAKNTGLGRELFENADEKASPNIFVGFARSYPIVNESLIMQESPLSNNALFKFQCEVITQIASKGSAVFVGRCADFILRDHPGLFSVFICGNNKDRIERLCRLRGISMEEAIKTIKKIDKQRSTYYKYYTDKTWGEASSYNVCINSSVLGIDGTVDAILWLLEKKEASK
ncbi:MAG TPA: cytidylate kinase-like family protein [Bacteroidetes bacterium]|nr:cytidylate kinase-like family protein [Bacteroidota bacterium]